MSNCSTGMELVLNAAEGVLQIIVTDNGQICCAYQRQTPDRGAEILAPALAEICTSFAMRPADFQRIACVRGPGSFTGIRLTLATAAGLRRTGKAVLAGLDYMQALATSAVMMRDVLYGTRVWVVTHARRNLVHCQAFIAYGPRIPAQAEAPVVLCAPGEARAAIIAQPGYICGSGLLRNTSVFGLWCDEPGTTSILAQSVNTPVIPLPRLICPSVEALCLLARHGDYFAEDLEPLYVRPCDAVENLPQLAARQGVDADAAVRELAMLLTRTPHSAT